MGFAGGGLSRPVLTELSLRCNSCGAPYAGNLGSEILTCTYCGTAQRVVDARQFLDHFTAQVNAFLRAAIPPGLDLTGSATIDPVARLAAFSSSVRPHLSVESDQYRFNLFNLLTSPLEILPFSLRPHPARGTSPAAVSVFSAKVQSVSGLAVDDTSRDLLARAGGVAATYQSLLVATNLLGTMKPERFHLVEENLESASRAIAVRPQWAAISRRLVALSHQSRAVDLLMTGRNLREVRQHLAEAGVGLSEARSQTAAQPEIGFMTSAIDLELASVRIASSIADILERSPTVAPAPLVYVQRLTECLDGIALHAPPEWSTVYRSLRPREEIFAMAAQLRAAQAGSGAVRWLSAGGGLLVPFWVVELPYTFETGVLWKKQGKEVPESILVAATFPSDLSTLAPMGASVPLTDIFAMGQRGPGRGTYYDRLAGRQQKISESGTLADIVAQSTSAPAPGQPAVPPLSTRAEAVKQVQAYLGTLQVQNPRVAGQLRMSSPRATELVYLPAVPGGQPSVPCLGALSPRSVGGPEALTGLSG